MATRQAWARWALMLAAVLAAPGCSSRPEAPQGNSGQAAKKDPSPAPSSPQPEPPKELTLDLGNGVTMKLVLIPAGKFVMGEKEDQHEVTLSRPFYMGVTEVTQAQYEAILGENPSDFKGETLPVDTVPWNHAIEFCKKLAELTRREVRLPTEAEWEYACRAGTETQLFSGDTEEGLEDYAWYSANSGDTTHPVGQKKPNAWGLYDMHGNVFEWCADWYGEYAARPATDPTGPATGSDRVLRGGCWFSNPVACRSAGRLASGQGKRHTLNGFGLRVVAAVGPGTQ